MFILLLERNGEMHIIDYKSPRGFYRSICSKIVYQNELVETLALDSSIDLICRDCHEMYNEMYLSDLNIDTSMARSGQQHYLNYLYSNNKSQDLGPEADYRFLLKKNRNWSKLNKYKSLISKKNKYAK